LPEHVNSEDFDNEQELKYKLNSKIEVKLENEGLVKKVNIP